MMPARAGFALLEPLDFSNEALAELRKLGLSDDLIETLRDALEVEAQAVKDRRADGRLGEIRAELEDIAVAADSLRDKIDGCDLGTAALLTDVERCGDYPPDFLAQLDRLAAACWLRAEKLPWQQARRSPEGLGAVSIAANVARDAGIRVSPAARGRFIRLVNVAFAAVGLDHDPRRAIEHHLAAQRLRVVGAA